MNDDEFSLEGVNYIFNYRCIDGDLNLPHNFLCSPNFQPHGIKIFFFFKKIDRPTHERTKSMKFDKIFGALIFVLLFKVSYAFFRLVHRWISFENHSQGIYWPYYDRNSSWIRKIPD